MEKGKLLLYTCVHVQGLCLASSQNHIHICTLYIHVHVQNIVAVYDVLKEMHYIYMCICVCTISRQLYQHPHVDGEEGGGTKWRE